MSDSCECGDIESCILCRFRQTYINAADAWQAGLAMVKECEALHEENQHLREWVGGLKLELDYQTQLANRLRDAVMNARRRLDYEEIQGHARELANKKPSLPKETPNA